MTSITLSELNESIKQVVAYNFDTPVWIKAEVSEIRENANGHCYLEFIEKDENSNFIVAKQKATVWATTWRMLKPYFESSTGQILRAGMNVLVEVSVEFHSLYGLSLNVKDIDPAFTIGELAARRMEVIRMLEADGVMDMNRELSIPVLPQSIAVISSPTAAGYEDFLNQLQHNTAGFAFYFHLFPSIMQGEQAEASIISSLEKIYNCINNFDVVVIIRGGGATTDLSCFDSYNLTLNCAQFPIPVITGIGHQRDLTVLDMVAHTSLKTPTAVAGFLIDKMQDAENLYTNIGYQISQLMNEKTEFERRLLDNIKWKVKNALTNRINQKSLLLQKQIQRLSHSSSLLIYSQQKKLELLEKSIESHSPAFLLKHGYSITTFNGKKLSSVKEIKKGDVIRTFLHDGDFGSEVN